MPFRPSQHGFRFANRFDVPLFGAVFRAAGLPATWGLCGGMVRLAREAFRDGRRLPQQREAPAPDTSLYRRLFRRQFATFGPPPLFPEVGRFVQWSRRSDAELARRTRPELRKARHLLEDGHLVPLGLVYVRSVRRLWENHQVLAYAPAGEKGLRIYDPNDPGRDDVALVPAGRDGRPAFQKHVAGWPARNLRGFFVMAH